MFAIAVIAAIAIVAVAIIFIYFAWRGYKTKDELFPFILSICAFPILLLLAGLIIHGNM
jgi:hypothetical protein